MEKRYSGNRLKIIHFVQTWKLDVTLLSKIGNLFLQVQQHQYSIEPNQQIYLNKGGVSSAEMGMMSTPTTQCKFWWISVWFYTELFPWSFCYKNIRYFTANHYWISNLCLTLHYFQFQNLYLDIWFQNWSVFSSIIKGFYNDYEGLNSK